MKRKQAEDGELDYEAWCIVQKKITKKECGAITKKELTRLD